MAEETKPPKTYEFHPIADLFPKLDPESISFKALIEDIKSNGQQQQIYLYESKILDGRNRYLACQHLGREVQTREYVGNDPIGFVLSINLHRRHLNTSQRGMVGAKLTSLEPGANQHTPGTSIEVASKLLSVGRASIERARQVLAHGDPSLIAEVEQGKISVTDAAATATGKTPDPGKDEPTASDRYDNAEKKLIEKLNDLKPTEAEAAATETIKKLRTTVATMLKAVVSAQAA